MKKYFAILACAVFCLAALAYTEFIALDTLIGCSLICALFLCVAVKASGSLRSIGCALLTTAVATVTWNADPNQVTFGGKLLSATAYGVIVTFCVIILVYVVKALIETIIAYYHSGN